MAVLAEADASMICRKEDTRSVSKAPPRCTHGNGPSTHCVNVFILKDSALLLLARRREYDMDTFQHLLSKMLIAEVYPGGSMHLIKSGSTSFAENSQLMKVKIESLEGTRRLRSSTAKLQVCSEVRIFQPSPTRSGIPNR